MAGYVRHKLNEPDALQPESYANPLLLLEAPIPLIVTFELPADAALSLNAGIPFITGTPAIPPW